MSSILKVKFWDINMWVDDHIDIQVLAEDEEEARVKAKAAIEERLGEGVSHGILDVREAYVGG